MTKSEAEARAAELLARFEDINAQVAGATTQDVRDALILAADAHLNAHFAALDLAESL